MCKLSRTQGVGGGQGASRAACRSNKILRCLTGPFLQDDYSRFTQAYWIKRLYLNLWLVIEQSITSSVGSAIYLLFLAVMGKAFFALQLDEIGTIVAILRFVEFMNDGVKVRRALARPTLPSSLFSAL